MVKHDADILDFGTWWKRTMRGGYSSANVWWLTRHSNEPLYVSQLRSSLIWAVAMPAGVALAAVIAGRSAILLFVPVFWLLQTARTAAKRGMLDVRSWGYAMMMMLARLPEVIGVARYVFSRVSEEN